MTSGNPAYVSALRGLDCATAGWLDLKASSLSKSCQRGEMATGTTGRPGVPKSRAGQGGEGYKGYSGNIKLPVFHLSELESIVYLFSPCGFDGLSKRCRKGRGGDWDYWTAWCAQEQSRAERINNKNRCFKIIFVTFIGYFARCADLAPM